MAISRNSDDSADSGPVHRAHPPAAQPEAAGETGSYRSSCGSHSANLGMMTIDERIERLGERVEALVTTAELHQKELQADAGNIGALARIAEIHERRLEAIKEAGA